MLLLPFDLSTCHVIEWGRAAHTGDARREFLEWTQPTDDGCTFTMTRLAVSIAGRAHRQKVTVLAGLLPPWNVLHRACLPKKIEFLGGHVAGHAVVAPGIPHLPDGPGLEAGAT
jgi:hypothetical protein